jgi:hypothetical protein
MKWKDLSLKERKQIYDSVRVNNPGATYFDIKEQFDSIPAYEDGGKSIVDEVNKSNANFVQRLKSPTRQTIPNWEDQYRVLPWEKSVSTHKLSVWDNANGGGTIVPDVQEVNGKLIDFTRPPYNNRAAVENALKTGDYVDLPKFEDALWYTENYKRYYPRFEDGGKNKNVPVLPKELGLTPGTPEYLERQKRISGSANVVQPEAYITPAGYIKDAVNFIEDLGKGDYAGAAIDAALNLIPWGVGKTIKKIKKKVGRAIEGTDAYTAESYAEPFTPTITKKKKGKKVKTEADYDQEFAEVKRKYNNMQEYDKELSKITNDLFMPTDGSVETLEKVDKAYGTNYKKAASAIAFQDMANRGKYVKHQQMYDSAGNPIYGRTTGKVDQPTIEDMTISLNPDYYLEGTANHEISHLADALVNRVHNADATNNYMEYLLDRDNIMSYNEIRQSLMDVNPNTYRYLTTPSENKAYMIQLKRGMQKEGLINNWTDPITQDKIEEYLSYRSKYANRVNPVLRTLYDIRPDKQGFVNRMNNLTPIEWAVPLGLPMFFGEEQENK